MATTLFASSAGAENEYDDEDSDARICLPSRGPGDAVPPALRLMWLHGQPGTPFDPAAAYQAFQAGRPRPGQESTQANMDGMEDAAAGRHEAAAKRFDQCRQMAVRAQDVQAEAICANNGAAALAGMGRYDEAQRLFDEAAQRLNSEVERLPASAVSKKRLMAEVLRAGPAAWQSGGGRSRTVADYMARAMADAGSEVVELNRGNLAVFLRQYQRAEQHLKAALALYPERPSCRPAAADDLLRLYSLLRRTGADRADAQRIRGERVEAERALRARLRRSLPSEEGSSVVAGIVVLSSVNAAVPDARVDDEREVALSPLAARGEAALEALLSEAARERDAGRLDSAAFVYTRAALRAAGARRAETEAAARAALMGLDAAAGRTDFAIGHGKRAANLLQSLRDAGLDRNARRAYLRDRERAYVSLAQLLLDAQRWPEAESVLRMLKEDEGHQFRATTAAKPTYASLTDTAAERARAAHFEQAVAVISQLDGARTAAVAADRTLQTLLHDDLATLERKRLTAGTQIASLLSSPTTVLSELRELSRESQQDFIALFDGGTARVTAALRELEDDLPRFKATPATPQQRAQIRLALRRAGELKAAAAPVVAELRRAPGQPEAQWAAEEPLRAMQRQWERATSRETVAAMAGWAMKQGQPYAARTQAVSALVQQRYMNALIGQGDEPSAARAFDEALRPLSLDELDAVSRFVADQGTPMAASQRLLPQTMTPLMPLLAALQRAKRNGAADNDAQTVDVQTLRARGQANADALERVRASMEASIARAGDEARRRQSFAYDARRALKKEVPQLTAEETRARLEMQVMEPLARLWRLNEQINLIERRYFAEAGNAGNRPPASAATAAPPVPSGVARIYLLPGDARTDVLVATADRYTARRLPIGSAELDAAVRTFDSALRNSKSDPYPPARRLHKMLIAPVETALSGVEVIELSLAGNLRFMPFAALHDGRQWLAERFAIVVDPGGRAETTTPPISPVAARGVAAFGASLGGAGLATLPAVPHELDTVVAALGASSRSRLWLNREFTAESLREALLGNPSVVHIASHFSFQPGEAQKSFLLLGDGSRLSLAELADPAYRFDRVELVTLSACETALSGNDAFGQEIDGLAALLMAQGAPAVLASLWLVNDTSTADLMAAMYRAGAAPGTTRAQALRQAQLALIRSGSGAPDATPGRGVGRPQDATKAAAGDSLGVAHPHYWAPFILMAGSG